MTKRLSPLHISTILKGEPVVLVAGGAGFLGSYLCKKLIAFSNIICLDNLQSGKRENIADFIGNEKFTFIQYDITKPIGDLIRKKVDYIFHVAGVDEVEKKSKATLEDLLLNTYGTRNLLEMAVRDHAKFLLVSTLEHEKTFEETINTAQARLFSENLTRQYMTRFGIDARVIRLGHLFGPRMSFSTQNPMAIIIKELVDKKVVEISNDELTRIYPVFVADCVDSILEAMFGSGTKGKIYNLIPWRSVTLRELAGSFAQIDPGFSFKFVQNGKQIKLFAKDHFAEGTTTAISPKEDIENQLRETMAYFQSKGKGADGEVRRERTGANEKRLSLRFAFFSFIASIVFFSTIMPLLFLGIAAAFGVLNLNKTMLYIEKGNFGKAIESATFAQVSFSKAQGSLMFLSNHFFLFDRREDYDRVFHLLKSGEAAGKTAGHLSNATMSLGEFFTKSIRGEGLAAKSELDRAIGELAAAAAITPLLEKELVEIAEESLPSTLAHYINQRQSLIADYAGTIAQTKVLAGLLPDLLGFEDKRVYLVLFQNNMELRPTGGFIGSYGIIIFEKGSLSSFDVFDVYQADGQLRGHVEPPTPIRKYLNQPNWYLRDSNWDADYQAAAAQAMWFLEKEVGIVPHGAVAIDVSFAQLLLEGLGPVTLPDYKETITSQNLFEKAYTNTELGFFPGSSQKRDFLGALARRIIDRLLHDKDVPWLNVLSAMKKGIAEKHVLFSFNNSAVQQVFNLHNWGGTVLAFPQEEGRFNDFRMINEANLGVNKVNQYMKRKINDEVMIGKEGIITGALSIQYSNDGPTESPGGNYVNYLRVFFPNMTKLTAVEIDGKEVPTRAGESEAAFEIEEATQSGKSVFGGLISVAPATSKKITFLYELPDAFPILPGSTTYAYVFQKQPGTLEDPLTVSVIYPHVLKMRNTNASVFQEKQMVTLSTNLAEDRLFTVEFLR